MLNKYLKGLTAVSILTVLLISSTYVVSAEHNNNNNDDENNQIWCHRIHDDKCQESQRNSCNDGWHQGRCVTPSPSPEISPSPSPEVSPSPIPSPSPEASSSATPIPTPGVGGTSGDKGADGGDGLGCANRDCSGNQVGGPSSSQGEVLGASTGPAVLGLSTTSGDSSPISLIQFALSSGFIFSGFKLFRKQV